MNLESLGKTRVLILGFGKEGIDSFKLLRKLFPKKIIEVADKRPFNKLDGEAKRLLGSDERKELYLGETYLDDLGKYDFILKSPGVPFYLSELEEARGEGVEITSQTEIFLDNCPGLVIGVTGTKGKSTTASLINAILRRSMLKTHLVGNIGKPALSLLSQATEEDIYVYEMSSHQLSTLKQSPTIAVFLNIFAEHLDYYVDFEQYVQAKSNIANYQDESDYLIYNGNDILVEEVASGSKAEKIDFNNIDLDNIISREEIPLKGDFNRENIKAAVAVARIFKIPDEKIKEAISKFRPLPHRLEFIGEFKGIEFYNDALSTIPEATIAAMKTLGDNVETIILGGHEREQRFDELAELVLESNIRNVILFPTTGERIWKIMKLINQQKKIGKMPNSFPVENMEDAVRIAYENTDEGKICLLSTASPSFGIFKDYKEKGELFKKYVKEFSDD
jgi:UDP-N-acetylmuramoylalanine--D-glutamate ligase